MENFFDIATPEEIEETFGGPLTAEETKQEIEYFTNYPDYNYQMLYWLYRDRGDTITANRYLDKIKDPEVCLTASMIANEERYDMPS